MSVHFITGKPRGGKSYYAMKLLWHELVHGSRKIVTNLAVELGELNAELQSKGHEIVLRERLQLLSDTEIGEFWLYRGPDSEPLKMSGSGTKREPFQIEGFVKGGVLYILDEVHLTFGARQWMDTGPKVLFYMSQHAKLSDDVICITQALELVDKQFRKLAQDFTYVTNQSKRQLAGFRLPKIFTRRTYDSPPGPAAVPMVRGTFTIDVNGLAKCYNTAKGVGIMGEEADKNSRVSGRPFWMLPVTILAIILGCWFLVTGCVKQGKRFIPGYSPPSAQVQVSQPEIRHDPSQVQVTTVVTQVVERVVSESTNFITGMFGRPGSQIRVLVSDGRVLTEQDFSYLSRRKCVTLGGETLTWKQ